MKNLKKRWGINSNFQLVIIFVAFAINGSLSAKISSFLMSIIGLNNKNLSWFFYYSILMLLVLPLYPFLLIVIGFLFGQFDFFFRFSKKMLQNLGLGFVFESKKKS